MPMLDENTLCIMHICPDADKPGKFDLSGDMSVSTNYGDASDVKCDKFWLRETADAVVVGRISTGDYYVMRAITDNGIVLLYGLEDACYEYLEVLNRA